MSAAKIALRDLQFKAAGCYAYAADVLGKRKDKFPPVEDHSGRVAIVTGGGRGIGLHIVEFLLKCNFTVIVGVRNPTKAETAIEPMENSSKAIILPLDLDSLQSVKSFSNKLLERFDKVDILVNNAGILLAKHALTIDGVERNFGVNYLGHFYLTHLLMPALAKAGSGERASRVVAVTSTTYLGGKIHFDDINLKEFPCRSEAYAQSKLALIMNSAYLAQMARQRGWNVSFFSVDPGIVNTEAFEGTPVKKYLIGAKVTLKSPQQGTRSVLFACLDSSLDGMGIAKNGAVNSEKEGSDSKKNGIDSRKDAIDTKKSVIEGVDSKRDGKSSLESKSGEFITNCGPGIRSKFSKSRENQQKLFQLSCDMIQIRPEQFGESEIEVTKL